MSLPETLPHICTIKESAAVKDEFAGADWDDPETLYENEPCWVQPAGSNVIQEFQRRDQSITHKVYLSRNLRIRPGNAIVPTTGPFAGAWLDVRACNECTAGTGLLWRAFVEEVQPR